MKICPACGLVYENESAFCFLSGDSLSAAEDDLVGTTVGGLYQVQGMLGRNPWARRYRARLRLFIGPCTIKLFTVAPDAAGRERFVKALSLARRCTVANVAEVIGGGLSRGGMAYVVHAASEAVVLSEAMGRGPMAPARAAGIGAQLLHGLASIHDFGGAHGSVQPTNVALWPNGHVELLEVGLGRALLCDPWAAEPHALTAQQHQAPEIGTVERASAQADLYALGVTVFRLLGGGLPHDADDVAELRAEVGAAKQVDVAGRLAAVPGPLSAWVARLMQPAAADRPANAHVALAQLYAACHEASLGAEADAGAPPLPGEARLDPSLEGWQRFSEIFTNMAQTGFPAGPPQQTQALLQMIQGRVAQLGEIAGKARYGYGVLNDVLGRARQGRQQIAEQMVALNDQAKALHTELEPLLDATTHRSGDGTDFPLRMRELHREILRWEGRSAFVEPYAELAKAYRDAAALIDAWGEVRQAELGGQREVESKQGSLGELGEGLNELRRALDVHESNLAAEIGASEQSLADLGTEADRLQLELLDAASRFCAPLRSKPELGDCFRQLAALSATIER